MEDEENNEGDQEDALQELDPDYGLTSSPILGLPKGLRRKGRCYRKGTDKMPGRKFKIRGDVPVKPSKKTFALRLIRKHRHMNGAIINDHGDIQMETPVIEHQALNHIASTFFLMLADCCTKATTGELWPLLESTLQIFHSATSTESGSTVASSSMAVDSLENLVLRLGQIERNLTGFNFIYMLDTIQLRGKVAR